MNIVSVIFAKNLYLPFYLSTWTVFLDLSQTFPHPAFLFISVRFCFIESGGMYQKYELLAEREILISPLKYLDIFSLKCKNIFSLLLRFRSHRHSSYFYGRCAVLVVASFVSIASAQARKLYHSAAPPLPKKIFDFSGTPFYDGRSLLWEGLGGLGNRAGIQLLMEFSFHYLRELFKLFFERKIEIF